MQDAKLKTAVLGLNDKGQALLEAASKIEHLQIQAIADKDTKLAETFAEKYNCTAYDDYRQLIIQNQLDCLLVAAAICNCDEYIRTAMKKKVNVLKLAPVARNFEEAVEFVHLAKTEDIKFAVANPYRFKQSHLALRQHLRDHRIEQVFLISVVCNVSQQPRLPWYTDPKLAGGAVLLRDCYQMIDQILFNFKMPELVYALTTNQAEDKQQRLYLTEDTALVSMKFADNFFATITASCRAGIGPEQKVLKVYGRDKMLTVSDTEFIASDSAGQIIEKMQSNDKPLNSMIKQLNSFALSILEPGENKLSSSAEENLKNMAVIESAYLSARTAMPEEPNRILKMAQIEPINIWPDRT